MSSVSSHDPDALRRGGEAEPSSHPRRHVLTVAIEDYFQVGAFNRLIQRGQWYRFEARVQRNTRRVLDLLDQHGVKATFFALGWIADHAPDVIREVAARGHEIASKGYYHRSIRQMTREEFRDDLRRSREALERAAQQHVRGYRVADEWLLPRDLWALDVLAEEDFDYDSSIAPMLRSFAHEPWRRFHHVHRHAGRVLHELPLSSLAWGGVALPIAGGNYMRQLPSALLRRAVARWDRRHDAPFVMYFHVWELDANQPAINAPLLTRIRHYRNLGAPFERRLRHYLGTYRFVPAAEFLGLPSAPATVGAEAPARGLGPPEPEREPAPAEVVEGARVPITVVVPCYNEELVLPYLSNTLAGVESELGKDYDLRFVFVDDGSLDQTSLALERIFGSRPNCRVVHHSDNRGVAAAILTGIRAANTEIVASIDCDCTYDPHQLGAMIPQLRPGVDLVTASPYHPLGEVRNVPRWRLFLSKGLSRLYRRTLRHKLATYTSCFRVYRRQALLDLQLRERGFLGVAEMIGLLDLRGHRIAEWPAVLEVRMLGRSKMKVASTIGGHLRVLARLWQLKLSRGGGRAAEVTSAAAGATHESREQGESDA